MAAMPSPQPDPGFWLGIAEHFQAMVGAVIGGLVTAGFFLWRIATWATGLQAEIKELRMAQASQREAVDSSHRQILDKLDDIKEHQLSRHEAVRHDLEQVRRENADMRQDVREGRAATAELSARVDRMKDGTRP